MHGASCIVGGGNEKSVVPMQFANVIPSGNNPKNRG